LKVEQVNPIYSASKEVFRNMFGWELKRGELKMVEDIVSKNAANVTIGVTGDIKGVFLFSFPENMALDIVREMSGMEFNEIDKFVASAMGELANIISGNAMNEYFQNKYNCDIVPPQISVGENKTFSSASDEVLKINLKTSDYSFDLYISVNENKQ